MGGDKLRRPWRGRPLIAWAAEIALAAPVCEVWVVTGRDPAIGDVPPADPRLRTVYAGDWAHGLSASLKTGVSALPNSASAVLVFLADMPRVPRAVAAALIQAWRDGALAAAPVCNDQRGHPVLLDRSLFPAVAALEGDRGAGALLARLGNGLTLVSTPDDGVLFDVDTPQALAG